MTVADFGDVTHLSVRLLAIELTESVRSFQVPPTPGTAPGPQVFRRYRLRGYTSDSEANEGVGPRSD